MTHQQFTDRLSAIGERTRQDVVELMAEAREQNANGMAGGEPVDFAQKSPNWERKADVLVELGAWIYDRMHGRDGNDKKSLVRKLRRALGYNQA